MKRLIITLTIILPTFTLAQTPQDFKLLNNKIIPKIQTLTPTESTELLARLINHQIKTKTARQRFFLGSISAFLMQKTGSGTILTGVVTAITDGDTFSFIPSHSSQLLVASSQLQVALKVRLLGIDTPEKGEVGNREATEYLTNTLLNTSVTLITPPEITTDKYGRILAYVLTSSGTLLNLDLLEKGLARTMIRQDHPFITLFSGAESTQNRQELTRRLYCTDFRTCDQARSAVASGAAYLDGDGDGLPCETSICKNFK